MGNARYILHREKNLFGAAQYVKLHNKQVFYTLSCFEAILLFRTNGKIMNLIEKYYIVASLCTSFVKKVTDSAVLHGTLISV
jgi:hypothetical protein